MKALYCYQQEAIIKKVKAVRDKRKESVCHGTWFFVDLPELRV